MNKQVLHGCVKAALLLTAMLMFSGMTVKAQSLEQKIKVNVPFNFTVGDKEFQSGEYVIQRAQPDEGDLILRVSSLDGKTSTMGMTFPVVGLELTRHEKLVFTRYGDRYFLSEVWAAGADTGRGLPKTSAERELAKNYPFEISSTTSPTRFVLEVQ